MSPSVGAAVFAFLQQNESRLRRIADEDQKRADEAMSQVFKIPLHAGHRARVNLVDLSNRPVPWTRDTEGCKLICDQPPNRGTVW